MRRSATNFCGTVPLTSPEYGHMVRSVRIDRMRRRAYTAREDVEMRSDWMNKLGMARGWLLGAAVIVAALVYLVRR